MKTFWRLLCIAGVLLSTVSARANVYATDIKINGSIYTATNATSSPVTITYRLNEAADLGVTVAILQGGSQIATIKGGTAMGLNTVVWGGTNNSGSAASPGTYSVAITAAASGFTNWTQISVDTNAGNYAADANGLAVNNNTNSPYYGRVVVGCATEGGVNPVSGSNILDGIYKYNADGSSADEGAFGYGGYTADDAGNKSLSAGEMPSPSSVVPWRLRIGADDRIYMLDYSVVGAVVAFDMQVTSNQVVIDEGTANGSHLGGSSTYANNPDFGDLVNGVNNFDVTTNAIWLNDIDTPPNWGIWMYHLTNGVSDPADTKGTQAVTTGGDLTSGSSGGCMIDANLDIFVSQSQEPTESGASTMLFSNWQGGVLPPEAGGTTYADGKTVGQVAWAVGAGDPTMTGINDTVINSRTQPTYVALPMGGGAAVTGGFGGGNSGIRVLNASNGTVVSVTNGASVQTLTNLDLANVYTCAAWDNVGNLYAASTTTNLWRVWSPPGTNTNTTVAVAQALLSSGGGGGTTNTNTGPITITSVTAKPNGNGCSTITLTFTGPASEAATNFSIVAASSPSGVYSPVESAVLTGSSGTYQAVFTSCSTEFYEVAGVPSSGSGSGPGSGPITITGITSKPNGNGCSTVTLTFTAATTAAASNFTIESSASPKGPYSPVGGAVITGSAGTFQAVLTSCSTEFYEVAAVSSAATVPITITGVTSQHTTPGCGTVTITFTANPSLAASAFTVVGAPSPKGSYSSVSGAVITGSGGTYQATFSNCSTEFYLIEQ